MIGVSGYSAPQSISRVDRPLSGITAYPLRLLAVERPSGPRPIPQLVFGYAVVGRAASYQVRIRPRPLEV
jgi:hypothetical protein